LITLRVLPCQLSLGSGLPGFTFRECWQQSGSPFFGDLAAIEALWLCTKKDLFGIVCFAQKDNKTQRGHTDEI
jgi:hypothetical protein